MTEPSAPIANTDREIWRSPDNGGFYADSIHVTQGGGIGINCGGHVIVKPLRDWHALALAALPSSPARVLPEGIIPLADKTECGCTDECMHKPDCVFDRKRDGANE